MLYRLNFDDKIFAALILKINARANGGSENKALQTMVIEWSALEDDKNLTRTCQEPVKPLTIQDEKADSENQLNDALDDLDDAW